MNTMIDDIIIYMGSFLCDKDLLSFLSTTMKLNEMKDIFYYGKAKHIDGTDKYYDVSAIRHLRYYDRFQYVSITNLDYALPKSITHLRIDESFNHDIDNLPNTIKYIWFDFRTGCPYFKNKIKLPDSVEILDFGFFFSQSLENIIPKSVKKLS